MPSQTLSRDERRMVTRLGWLLIAFIQAACIVVLIDVYEFSASYRSLMIVMLVFGLLVFLMSTFIFLSRGGAKYQSYYLSFVSFVLYVHAILCLYSSGATIYFMAVFPKRAGNHLVLFRAFCIIFAVVSVFFIYLTTQMPHLVGFLREFRRYARSEKIFLPRYICTCFGSSKDSSKSIIKQVDSATKETEPLVPREDVEKGEQGADVVSPRVDTGKPPKKRRFFFGA
jgi:hypothetical protein